MFNNLKAYWRGLVGNTQKDMYTTVSGRRFAPCLENYRNPTFLTCIDLLCREMSNIHYKIYAEDQKEVNFDQFRKVFSVKANRWHTTAEFLRIMEYNRLMYGNAYAYIKWGRNGGLDELVPLNPQHMKVLINDSIEILESDIIYEYADGKNVYTFLPDELIHVRANSKDGIKGLPSAEILASLLRKSGLADEYLDEIMNNG